MIIGVPKEVFPGERRVALVPGVISSLPKGTVVRVERGAGLSAGYPDSAFEDKGATLVSREEVYAADLVVQVRAAGANGALAAQDASCLRDGQTLIAFLDPLGAPDALLPLAERGASLLSIEMMPRITRAQSMDALSSMAMLAGYKAVLLAAGSLPRMMPMMMTAAGTISPGRVFVVGAGVAGLQAIATAKRLGGVIRAYDVRPAVADQVRSVGAEFVELPIETASSEDAGGYAKAQDASFYAKQRELMASVVAQSDIVITTAAIPGRRSPVLITEEMVAGMAPGSVIVDLAAERGGNCELTRADETVVAHGVTILGPTNLPSSVPFHASQLYAKNVVTFVKHLVKDGSIQLDTDDEIVRETLVARGGAIVHERIKSLLQAAPVAAE